MSEQPFSWEEALKVVTGALNEHSARTMEILVDYNKALHDQLLDALDQRNFARQRSLEADVLLEQANDLLCDLEDDSAAKNLLEAIAAHFEPKVV